jgi:hypothetical protein
MPVSCSLSFIQYDIFSPSVNSRLIFATSAMHAYAHQWACQLLFNPRLQIGFGLSDGEGVERLWSRLRKLIGVTRCSGVCLSTAFRIIIQIRNSQRTRRIWLLDRQASFIGHDLRDSLGEWIRHRLIRGVQAKSDEARDILGHCGIPLADLRAQWELQKASQLSMRARAYLRAFPRCAHSDVFLDAPARLKKEIDTVLTLQAHLDEVNRAISDAETMIAKMDEPSHSLQALQSLERTHERLGTKVEALFASLNIQGLFSELNGIDLDFVRTLLMARDLKINIRKRAIGSFFEWDKLDQAVGGRGAALGEFHHSERSL